MLELHKMLKIRYFYFSMEIDQFTFKIVKEKRIFKYEFDTEEYSYRNYVLNFMKDVVIAFPNLEYVHLVYPYDDVQPLLEFVNELPQLKRFHSIYNSSTGKEHGKAFLPHFIQRKIRFTTELSQGMVCQFLDFDLYKLF